MNRFDDREQSRRRWWILPVLVLGSLVVLFGWFDQSKTETVELGTPSRIVIINTAGPVRIYQGETSTIQRRDSWVLSEPTFDVAIDGGDVLIRVVCNGWTPCRSSIDLQITGAPDVLVVAEGFVDVESFDGKLTIFSSKDGVALGPVGGSVRVVSTSDVVGYGLRTELLDVSAVDDVDLTFGNSDDAHRILIVDLNDEVRSLDEESVNIELESDGDAQRSVAIRAGGDIELHPTKDLADS